MIPGTTRTRWPAVSALAARDDVVIGLGLHPYFIDDHRDEDLDALEEALAKPGEVVPSASAVSMPASKRRCHASGSCSRPSCSWPSSIGYRW